MFLVACGRHSYSAKRRRLTKLSLLLIIEDNPSLREATGRLLESRGYEVVAVDQAAEALRLLRSGLRPSLIFFDLIMADMDGFQFREQQVNDPDLAQIPALAWSAHFLSPSDRERLHGVTVIPKPIGADVILQAIAAHCEPRR